MASRAYHVSLDVRGALTNWSARELRAIRHPGGRAMTAREARSALMDELAAGHEVVPLTECDKSPI